MKRRLLTSLIGVLVVAFGTLITIKDVFRPDKCSGVITCAETGECNASAPVFYVVKDGAWVPAE